MQISGNTLPVVYGQFDQASQQARSRDNRAVEAYRDNTSSSGQQTQTAEYVFRGDLLDDILDQQTQNPYAQVIDPSKASAIASYQVYDRIGTSSLPRSGSIVDMYI